MAHFFAGALESCADRQEVISSELGQSAGRSRRQALRGAPRRRAAPSHGVAGLSTQLERAARPRSTPRTRRDVPRRAHAMPFNLSRLSDTVQIQPRDFGKDLLEAITAALNEKYPNRVVPQLGLCIALYDVVAVGEAQIHPGSAAHHTHVEFRLVVFRPFVGEVLEGTIIGCDEAGLRVSMGFFDNIHVPRHLIGFAQGAVRWSPDERLWFWQVDEASQLWFDTGDPHLKENPVRFRVQEVAYSKEVNVASKEADTGATGAGAGAGAGAAAAAAAAAAGAAATAVVPAAAPDGAPKEAAPEPPMQITACIDVSGLGLVSWWPPEEVGGDEMVS